MSEIWLTATVEARFLKSQLENTILDDNFAPPRMRSKLYYKRIKFVALLSFSTRFTSPPWFIICVLNFTFNQFVILFLFIWKTVEVSQFGTAQQQLFNLLPVCISAYILIILLCACHVMSCHVQPEDWITPVITFVIPWNIM